MKSGREISYAFNIIILGNYQVGKTAITQRLCNDVFESDKLKVTCGVGFLTKDMVVDNNKVTLNIRDTAGDERYQSLMKMYYNELHGAVIVYDISAKTSIDKLKYWIDDLDINGNSMECRVVIGNKVDMEKYRQVGQFEGKSLAASRDMDWCECSAKTSEGIKEAFEALIRKMIHKYDTNSEFKKIGVDESFITLSSSVCPVVDSSDKSRSKKDKLKSGCC